MTIDQSSTIGFIGTGVMGQGMINNLLQAGFRVLVHNRTQSRAQSVISNGAEWVDQISDLAEQSDCIITIVGYPQDVEEVYFEKGIINHAREGSYLIDMTTSSPSLAVRIAAAAKEKGLSALDAPVSGGDVGAKNGTLSIMVGGEEEAFQAVKSVFEAMGDQIVYQGKAGAGQHTKMANQIAIASNMMGVVEALIYAKKAGLDQNVVLESIGSGAAGSWSLSNLGPRMIKGDFAPGFYIKHFIKDMQIALESAEEMGLMTPGLKQAKALYDELAEMGGENSGTQALYKLYLEK